MIRAFVAIPLDRAVRERIAEVQSELGKTLSGIRWTGRENLHLTLKFLGGVEDEKVAPIAAALAEALRPISPFSLLCRGLGVFPDIRKPRVLWAGLEGAPLGKIAASIEAAAQSLGFEREKREFKPHLTIGRWREFGGGADALRREVERRRAHDFGSSEVNEVIFFQSVLKPGGPVYTPLRVFPLREKQT